MKTGEAAEGWFGTTELSSHDCTRQGGTGFASGFYTTGQRVRYDQAYDAVNRITRIDSSVDEASVYNYDKTGQLLTAQMTFENNEAYTYDANGNRTSGGTISNGAHKNLVTQDAKYTYLYDGENNRIRRTERATGNYQLYTWDHRNRLTKVEFVNTSGVTVRAIEYRYDASDMKVAEFVDTTAPFDMANASAKWFIYDGGNVVLDFARADVSQAPGATISKRYFQGPGVDQLLAQENLVGNASQSVWWVLPDHLGSTRDLVTASGSVIAHFQFDSSGNILDGRENVTRYQFTGREHDSNTDLNYHRARWYDPSSGKWLSEDPIGFAAGDANVTRYVGNGVLNGVDPSGLWWQYPPSTAGNPNPPPTWIPDAPEDPPYGTPKPLPPEVPSHFGRLQAKEKWTYSRHRVKLRVKGDIHSEQQILDYTYGLLKKFTHFNNEFARVRTETSPPWTAYFNMNGIAGLASDFINDWEVIVHLNASKERREIIGQTYGRHQLVGIRKWRVRSEGYDTNSCDLFITIETEADEHARGLNGVTENPAVGWLSGARSAMARIWKGYLERTADDVLGHFGGRSRNAVEIVGPNQAINPRPNVFAGDAWAD